MAFHDVAFLPSRTCFPPNLRHIVLEVSASRQPHVIELWMKAS